MKLHLSACLVAVLSVGVGCSAGGADKGNKVGPNGSGATSSTGGQPVLATGGTDTLNLGGGVGMTPENENGNPETCADAEMGHTYVGCDFWPTIVANPVYVEFEPAVVIANGTSSDAMVTITGPASFSQTVTVKAGGLETVMLKWVMGLKGPEFSLANTSGGRLDASARVNGGAYHMVSTVPVTAWQFNPLKYKLDAGECNRVNAMGCRSATNDASLLIPSSAMTEHYRVFGYSSENEDKATWGTVPGGIAITATKDGTEVQVQLGPKCGVELFPTTDIGTCVAAGPADSGIDAKNHGESYTLMMNAGDVVQLVGAWSQYSQTRNADMSGTIVSANDGHNVQVVSFNAIALLPDVSVANADHMEETVLPGEVLGDKYIVAPPPNPLGQQTGHVVRIYGNVDGTVLTYPEGKPTPDAPDMINAGEVVQIPKLPAKPAGGGPAPDCYKGAADHCMLDKPFVVQGTEAFAVASFMVGGVLQMPGTDPTNSQGDPSMTMEVTPKQFRKDYTFLAPADYIENYADVLVPSGAAVTLDGSPASGTPVAIGNSGWSLLRLTLDNSGGGVHKLSTEAPEGLGLQVMGFGYATSYSYPGGLNLQRISKPPVIVK